MPQSPVPGRRPRRSDCRRPQRDRVPTPIAPRPAIARCRPERIGAVRRRRRSGPTGSDRISPPHRPMPERPPAAAPGRSASASSARFPSIGLSDPPGVWRQFFPVARTARRAPAPLVQMRVLPSAVLASIPIGPDPDRFDGPVAESEGRRRRGSRVRLVGGWHRSNEWLSRTLDGRGMRARGAGAGGAGSGGSKEEPGGEP